MENDELQFLRGIEQDVQLIRSCLPNFSPVTASNLATTLKVKLGARITELLEQSVAREEEMEVA